MVHIILNNNVHCSKDYLYFIECVLESTIKPVSYLNIPREVLEKSIKQFELAEKRAEKCERLQKLPVFQIK